MCDLRAQQEALSVIGFLGSTSLGPNAPLVAAFRQGLSETGYPAGQNVTIKCRWAEGQYDRLLALAADLIGRKVNVIVTQLMPKRLELLSELVPQTKVIALLVNPKNPNTERIIGDVQGAARTKGVQLAVLHASNEEEIAAAFATLARLHAGALLIGTDT